MAFALHDNYPNPFNPLTEIAYQLPETGHVSLEIFNARGRHIQGLRRGVQYRGAYRVVFDAHGLSGGIYYYRLSLRGKGGAYTEMKKMVLLR